MEWNRIITEIPYATALWMSFNLTHLADWSTAWCSKWADSTKLSNKNCLNNLPLNKVTAAPLLVLWLWVHIQPTTTVQTLLLLLPIHDLVMKWNGLPPLPSLHPGFSTLSSKTGQTIKQHVFCHCTALTSTRAWKFYIAEWAMNPSKCWCYHNQVQQQHQHGL